MTRAFLRLARADDAGQVAAIYAPHVRDSAISFEVEPPTVEAMRSRIAAYLEHAAWLVCERGGQIAGYAYASRHRERLAYQWDVEVSVYVHDAARRKGVGRALYIALFRLLALQGFVNAYAGITLPNPNSVGLHESLGFTPVGVYSGAGCKNGAWHDVGWWQLQLQPRTADAPAPKMLDDVVGSAEWDNAIAASAALLQV